MRDSLSVGMPIDPVDLHQSLLLLADCDYCIRHEWNPEPRQHGRTDHRDDLLAAVSERTNRAGSASRPFRSVSYALKFLNNPVSMVSLDFDPSVFDRAARAKPGLQLGRKLGETVLVQRKIGDDRYALATSALRLSAHSNNDGLARWRRLACAGGLELMTLGAEQFSPVVVSHRNCRGCEDREAQGAYFHIASIIACSSSASLRAGSRSGHAKVNRASG